MKKNAILGSTLVILTCCLLYLVLLEKSNAAKPQDPKLPYPYRSQEVRFRNNGAGINLSGTLTLPAKAENVPAVILITGSGPHERNEEVLGHRPFLVIADYLTRHGCAVLRYDDRGSVNQLEIL